MATMKTKPLAEVGILDMETIIRMQLEDAEQLKLAAKGKQKEGILTDAEMALQAHIDEWLKHEAVFADQKMARSMAHAVIEDGNAIQDALTIERQIASDAQLAARLSENAVTLKEPVHKSAGLTKNATTLEKHVDKSASKHDEDPWQEPEMLAKARAIYMGLADEAFMLDYEDMMSNTQVAESSSSAAARNSHGKAPIARCVACGDEKEFFEVARVPCNHEYCRPCLEELFTLSMKDESLFPPRCDGQEITLKRVRFFLPAALAIEFESRYQELSAKNRTYCHELCCQTFIPATCINADDVANCPKCGRTTCTICKAPSHSGDCPQDMALQALIDTAEVNQWQRCYQCNRFVELNTGCNHITCPCGAQFCYDCAEPWKECPCPQWHPDRLIARATQLVDRNPRRQLFQPVRQAHTQPVPVASRISTEIQRKTSGTDRSLPDLSRLAISDVHAQNVTDTDNRTARIAAAVENLRLYHACTHEKWRWVRGGHTCEECDHWLPEYIFECRQCELQACNRCRRNRL